MGWFVRMTESGPHVVYSQKASNSCGIACIIMVNFKMKKWMLAAAAGGIASGPIGFGAAALAFDATVKAEEEVYAAYAEVTGQPYDGTSDTRASQLPKVLNKLDIGTWTAERVDANKLSQKVMSCLKGAFAPPVIILVRWRTSGGHFVVCDNIQPGFFGLSASADFCDPWDGAVRTLALRLGQPITYQTTARTGVDFGQDHNAYSSVDTGDANGWIVYRTG